MRRRDFLKLSGAASLALAGPRPSRAARQAGRWDRVIVLVELAGGNDGLNTVVPFRDPAYRSLRPRLALPHDAVLRLSDELALHPALEPLMAAWTARELAVVSGVGYPSPNRSHFRSIEIWETGSDSDEVLDAGWLARLFRASPPPADAAADGLVLGSGDAGPLAGAGARAVTMRTPEAFLRRARRVPEPPDAPANPALAHVVAVQAEITRAASSLGEQLRRAPEAPARFPGTPIGRDLEAAARLLAAGVTVPVLKVAHRGFDTHANQLPVHARLLGSLAEALASFRTAAIRGGLWDRVLVMTYSEFGRRAAENGSGGTDHGTAAPHFLLGGRVKAGLHGKQPSLTELSSGDLVHAVDFRRLHATVARRWWELPAPSLDDHEPLDVLR